LNTSEKNLQTTFSNIDLLTGCFNLVSFSKAIEDNFGNTELRPLTFIALDVYQLRQINRTLGFDYGDQLLRWLGIALRDEMGNTIYRISGEEFVVVLIGDFTNEHDQKARDLFERLNHQAKQLKLNAPVVLMTVIRFPGGQVVNTALVWKNLNEKMELPQPDQPLQIVEAESIQDADRDTIRAIELMAKRVVSLGYMLNVTFRMAYTDPVGNLPNMIATQRKLDLTFAEASSTGHEFCLFLIDGDDLKRYNKVSYAAGDKLIQQLSATITAAVRPDDFVGRWRFGDEFIVLLPDTNLEDALRIADRVRAAVQKTSWGWRFPTTISIGAVHYPKHGNTIDTLMEKAELALSTAKSAGKNRTAVAT
jgi:diguanylate cyclase (GGDEF)-like protein